MGVDHIEPALAGDLGELGGEPEGVGRVAEQRVGGDLHLVEAHPRMETPQPERHRVTDHMDIVAAFGEPDGKLRSHRPAPAVGR